MFHQPRSILSELIGKSHRGIVGLKPHSAAAILSLSCSLLQKRSALPSAAASASSRSSSEVTETSHLDASHSSLKTDPGGKSANALATTAIFLGHSSAFVLSKT